MRPDDAGAKPGPGHVTLPDPNNPNQETDPMRILCMHKATPQDEAGILPSPELIEGMGQLIGEACEKGLLLAGEGLRPSSVRLRLAFHGGRCDVSKGPFRGDNELPQRLVILKVGSEQQAIDWARRFGEAVGATRLELGPLVEEWDLGFGERPADAPLRYMIVQQATADSEAGKPATAAAQQGLRTVLAAMQKEGVLVFTEALRPSREGTRLNFRDNSRTRTDGPFLESKELIGGFCMMQMHSIDEMVAFCDRFARIVGGTCEIDVRIVAEPDGGAS